MRKNRLFLALSLMLVFAMLLTGCKKATEAPTEPPEAAEPTEVPEVKPTEPPAEPPPTEVPEAELGSAERPIQVYFVPSVEVDTIVAGGEVLRQVLTDLTGYEFEVFVPTSYGAFVEGFCAEPEDAIGFPATTAYVVANARCGVDAALIAERYGDAFYYSGIYVPRDSTAESISDLDGLAWGFTDAISTSGFIVPTMWLPANGVTPVSSLATGGHTQAILAVYNGEVDFSTAYFNPPQPIEGSTVEKWEYGDPVEPFLDVVADCGVDENGEVICGDWQIEDARNRLAETSPDVIQKVRLLTISEPIPNDCLAFGPEFPADLRAEIVQVILDLQEDEEMWEATLEEIYNYSGMIATTDATYDVIRDMLEAGGISMEDLVAVLDAEE